MDNPLSAPRVTSRTDFPGPGSRTWRTATPLLIGAATLGLLAVVGGLLLREPLDRVVVGVTGLVMLVVTVVAARRRLVGGPRGLLICGLTGARIVPWSTVRGIECGKTKRMGSATLEIDLVDDELILLGRIELGADPAAVAAELAGWFAGRN